MPIPRLHRIAVPADHLRRGVKTAADAAILKPDLKAAETADARDAGPSLVS